MNNYDGRQTKNAQNEKRYHFGKTSSSKVELNDGLYSRSQDNKGNYVAADYFGNAHLIHNGDKPDFSYQKKYNISTYDDENGIKGAFISVTDNEVVNTLVEGWANPTANMLATRKTLATDDPNDTGEWNAPTAKVAEMLTDWKKTYTAISSGNNMGGYLNGGMKKTASVENEKTELKNQALGLRNQINKEYQSSKFKVQDESLNIKSGMIISCSDCGYNKISVSMNFCPSCGHKFN